MKIKAVNGAGLTTISTSNGVYISYLSQGLQPLSHVGVWDADPIIIGDMYVRIFLLKPLQIKHDLTTYQ